VIIKVTCLFLLVLSIECQVLTSGHCFHVTVKRFFFFTLDGIAFYHFPLSSVYFSQTEESLAATTRKLVFMLIWFISCQLVKAERHVDSGRSGRFAEFNWAAAWCLEASNPAVAFSHLEQESNAVNRWQWISGWNYVHQVARVSSALTPIAHFDPRRSKNVLLVVTFLSMEIKRYLLLISNCYWIQNVDVKIYRWYTDLARRNQFAKLFNSNLEVPVNCLNGVPRVSRCLFLGVRLIPSTAKSNCLIKCLAKVLQI
jgi:hypothetical protein